MASAQGVQMKSSRKNLKFTVKNSLIFHLNNTIDQKEKDLFAVFSRFKTIF